MVYSSVQRISARLRRVRWHALGWSVAIAVVFSLSFGLLFPSSAIAAPTNLAKQPAMEVHVSLGTADNDLVFVPDHLEFQSGKRYKLVLDNPSPQKHYFTAKDFADVIWSQKVEAGKVEVKGAIHEVELKPGAIAEWVFVPVKAGTYELHCSIAGHTEAGMKGSITIPAA